ncbi:MAG: hypothetical protein K2P13_03455, partial [Lachnospiraceae bacterium]|nr:hypothetical protein [Lachnospiraceae bacterium]
LRLYQSHRQKISNCAVGVLAPSAERPLAPGLLVKIGNFTYEMQPCQGETAMDGGFRHLRHGCRLMPPRLFSISVGHFISGIRFASSAREPKAVRQTGPVRQPHSWKNLCLTISGKKDILFLYQKYSLLFYYV